MSEVISKDERPKKVTSIGNSWIVCKSKSHPGHIYYFNSLTGVPCWNLSDEEMERARNMTKQLGPGAKPKNCPEPKDKPPSTLLNNSVPPQSLSTEQFVRISEKQSSVLTYSNVANNNPTFSMPFNQIPRQMQGTQISNTSSIDPNSLNSYHLNTTPTVYNPNVWAVPHTPQVFIAPGLPSVVNHSLGPLNVAFNQLSSTVPQPATGFVLNSFENASQPEINTSGTRTFYPRDFNIGFTNKNDLRQKLSMKRRLNRKSYIPGGSGMANNPRNADNSADIGNRERIHFNDSKTGLESRCIDKQFQFNETPSKINLDPLKSLAPSDSKSDAWFIVVDLEVLLHEFKFLTTLTDSDDKCHLMVPKRVMEELKNYVSVTENIQTKRILRFLSHQIEVGYAFTAEVEGDDMAKAIHETCKELSDKKYHLILLSNDDDVLTTCSSNINKFHVGEVKNLLMEISNKPIVSSGPKKPFMSDELINKIKITVPNSVPQKIDTISPVKEDHIENISKTPHKQNNTPDNTEKLVSLKNTVDAGIQTDLEDINASISISNVVDRQCLNVDSNIPIQNTKETTTSHSVSIIDKKREIKLNRSTSHQPQENAVETVKKHFKWRRRRNTSPQCQINKQIQPHNDQNMTSVKNPESLETNTLNKEISKLPKITFNNSALLGCGGNKITDDSIESRESSINTEPRNSTSKGNITIEETSTSGIISNTESNVDADSNYSNSNNSVNQQYVYNGQSDKPMYEVDSITMEQYLKMKCDEWISRFIQIMEEVLSQVLLQDPPFTHSAMPPPWTLHEAAQCIALKYRGHQGIMAAASQLSTILFQVSDSKGKITMNMSPYQYMQMYSYGAHLLAALMEVATSEDIQIAVESLNKLLHDIRNPNMDVSTNDTFSDNKQTDHHTSSDTLDSDVPADNSDLANFTDGPHEPHAPDNNEDGSSHEQEMLPDLNQTEGALKDKLKTEKSSEEELQKPVKFIRNFDISFAYFEKMRNQKINTANTDKSPIKSSEKQFLTRSHIGEQTILQNVNENTEKGTDSDLPANQPNIIRKFNKCQKYEEKLNMNCNLKMFNDYEEEELDYDESYDEYVSEDYCPEDENHDDQCHNANDNQTDEKANTSEDGQPNCLKDVNTLLRDDNNEKFKFMVGTVLQEITKALSQVQILCEQCYTEFKKPKLTTKLECQLRKYAETAHLKTLRLYRSLERMLDTADSTQRMSELLEQTDIDIRHVDAELLIKYRISVDGFKNITDDFLKALKNIISKTKR